MATEGGSSTYGIRVQATPGNTGSTLIIERALNVGMTTSLVTVFSQAGVKTGVPVEYTDLLSNDGVTRYYRATESRTGYQSAQSSVISSAPYDLGGA